MSPAEARAVRPLRLSQTAQQLAECRFDEHVRVQDEKSGEPGIADRPTGLRLDQAKAAEQVLAKNILAKL